MRAVAFCLGFPTVLLLNTLYASASSPGVLEFSNLQYTDSPMLSSSFSSDDEAVYLGSDNSDDDQILASLSNQYAQDQLTTNPEIPIRDSNVPPVLIKLGTAVASLVIVGILVGDKSLCRDSEAYWAVRTMLSLLIICGILEWLIGIGFSVYLVHGGPNLFWQRLSGCSRRNKFVMTLVLTIIDFCMAFTKVVSSGVTLEERGDLCPAECKEQYSYSATWFPEYWVISAATVIQVLIGLILTFIFSKF